MAKKSSSSVSEHIPDPDAEASDGTPSKKRVNKGENTDREQHQADSASGELLKKRKKRKRDVIGETEGDIRDTTAGDLPKKKKHKNKTGLADPREDTVLSNQARKALEYAFFQFHRPSKWKFNKARQNWIIRNVWSAETVPEIYLPLVTKYLTNVQGGSRTKLIETCRSILDKPNKPEAEKTEEHEKKAAPEVLVPAVEVAVDRHVRAQTLLDALAAPPGVQ